LILKLCEDFLQNSQVNPRQAQVLDYSFLKALLKHMEAEFGLKTIGTEEVRQSHLDCLWKLDFHLQLHWLDRQKSTGFYAEKEGFLRAY
jgi:hypothetical protein